MVNRNEARPPERIPSILEAIQIYWEAHPDMRFFQICEAFASYTDGIYTYYVEDDELLATILRENTK